MRRDVLEERDEDLKEKKNALKERLFNFGTSDKFVFRYGVTILILAIVYFIRVFSDSGYDTTTRIIECLMLWLASFRHYFLKAAFPDSRSARWWFRILVVMSIMSTIYLILGLSGPRLPWTGWRD